MKRLIYTKEMLDACLRIKEAERQLGINGPRLSWAYLVALEPRLGDLLETVQDVDSSQDTEQFSGQSFWYEEFKPQLVAIIGHYRPDFHSVLSTSDAYELAYTTLTNALPPCRNCSCCRG